MPRVPQSQAYRSILSLLRSEMHSTERTMLEFSVYRFDEMSPSERAQFSEFSNRYREILQELCELCRQQGI